MSLQAAAQHLAARGRGPDKTLVHMSPNELSSLQKLALAHGGNLTINPETGLPEAGFLDSLLPALIGGGLAVATGGTSLAMDPTMIGLGVGALQAARTGDIQKGLVAGLGAYGGAGLAGGLIGAGTEAAANTASAGMASPEDVFNKTFSESAANAYENPEMFRGAADQAAQKQVELIQGARQQAIADAAKSPLATAGQGLKSIFQSPGSLGSFASQNLKPLAAAAVPSIMGMQPPLPPGVQSSGPNPFQYRYQPGAASPTPMPDVPGYGRQGQNFGREQRYFTGSYMPVSNAQDPSRPIYMAKGGSTSEEAYTGYKGYSGFYPEGGLDGSSTGPSASSAPGQGISSALGSMGLGMMGIGEGVPGISTAALGALGSAIAGNQADAMGQSFAALSDMADVGAVSPGVSTMSDSEGNVVSVSTPTSIAEADVAMGLSDASDTGDSGEGGEGGEGGDGGGSAGGGGDGGGDGGGGGGDGGGGGGDGGGGEAHGGYIRAHHLAMGGLGDYSDGGRLLRGPGDGVSDSIPATIGGKRPARLADGEFVVPARIVSELGNGSTEAGARQLYAMMDRIQKARGKTVGKGKVAKNTRASKYLPA